MISSKNVLREQTVAIIIMLSNRHHFISQSLQLQIMLCYFSDILKFTQVRFVNSSSFTYIFFLSLYIAK